MGPTREYLMSRISVLFFASLKDEMGIDEVSLDSNNLSDLMDQLKSQFGEDQVSGLFADNVRIAVNKELIEGDYNFSDNDEVAFLPPVTGG